MPIVLPSKEDLIILLKSRSYINPSNDCWEWNRSTNAHGYGQVYYNRKLWAVHRLSYTLFYGPIPPTAFVCHICDNPSCWNPEHLSLGNPRSNATTRNRKGGGATLTWPQVIAIRQRHSIREDAEFLAIEYGVQPQTIRDIINRKTWYPEP